MTVVAISMVRDEADIIEATVGHMIGQVDHIIVADNRSVDGTRGILESLDITVVDDPEVGYFQSDKITALAHRARLEFGATWVVPFDADEWWVHPEGRIADVLESVTAWPVVEAELFDHVATGVDPDGPPVERMQWRRRTPSGLPKVACRTGEDLVIHQGNHGASYEAPHLSTSGLVVHHFPYRSAEQFSRKAANGAEAYAATDLSCDIGKHWRDYGALSDEQRRDVFRRWFWVPEPDDSFVHDPVITP